MEVVVSAGRASEVPYTTRPLDASTWDAFAKLVERNNGIYGGCWCVAFHTAYHEREISDNRTLKEQLVRAGDAHAALVFDDHGLAQIAAAGGGLVEAISETTIGRQAQGRFLFSATVELFEQFGFARGRQVGKHAWIVSRDIDPG
jgi:hypothetical protein